MAARKAQGWLLAVAAVRLTMPWALSFEPLAAHNPITTKVTWTREISAILQRRCVSCHQPGGFAGFSLITYDDARPWAVAIKEEVLAGDMPPWGAAPGVGHFANDRRLTRHEQELVTAWVDGGAPYSLEARTPAFAAALPIAATPHAQPPARKPTTSDPLAESLAVPLAPMTIATPLERTASVTLALPDGMTLAAWSFEPGLPASVERADVELGSRWVGTWTPGDAQLEFPADVGVPLTSSALFTARIRYRALATPAVDRSRLRIWMVNGARPRTLREITVVRSWRTTAPLDLLALRPAGDDGDVQVLATYANGRAEVLGALTAPARAPHPTYRLAQPLTMPAGALVQTTAPVRLLYSAEATRTVNAKVNRRPRR